MRETFSKLLTDAALADDRILLLTGDHGYALFDLFRARCPDQFVNCGIAEQNMVGVAAGLAKAGYRPVVYGLAAFVPMRVLEQIKMDICYQELPVLLIGDGAGIVYGQLGASHQSTEDLSAVLPLPNIDIYAPCDRFELDYCFKAMTTFERPSYFRFGKADRGDIHKNVPTAPMGDLIKVSDGADDLAIIAHGSMVRTATALSERPGGTAVWSAPVLKPLNAAQLIGIGNAYRKIVVIEEHARHGGLGSIVSSILCEKTDCRVATFGTEKFSSVCGDYNYLLDYHGLGENDLYEKIQAFRR